MTYKIFLLSVVAFFGLTRVTEAQTATAVEFFHDGAQSFVASELPAALNYVESGLSIEPDHSKLLALKEKIEEQMEQQEGNNSEQSSENEQEQNQENEDQQSDQEQEESEQEQEKSDDEQKDQEGEDKEESDSQDENQNSPEQQQPPDPNQLTKEQAERILQALENEEEKLLREVQKIKGRPRRVEKDW